jgi:hypothetical protein
MNLIKFNTTAYSLRYAKLNITALVNASTDLVYGQKQDCLEVLSLIPSESDLQQDSITRSFNELGTYGYRVYITFFANRDTFLGSINAGIQLEIDLDTPEVVSPNVVPTSSVEVTPVVRDPWVPPAVPVLPARGALSANFTSLSGITIILPNIIADIDPSRQQIPLNTHSLNGVSIVTNAASNYIKASVVPFGGGNIPTYTLAQLYVDGTAQTSGYSVTDGLRTSIDLYTTINSTGPHVVNLLITTTGTDWWIPVTSMECSGGIRFFNGSCRGYIVGPSAVYVEETSTYFGPYNIAFTAAGCTPGTYLAESRIASVSSGQFQILNSGNSFNYLINGSSDANPVYGYSVPGNTFNGTAGTSGKSVYDVFVDFTVTDPLTTSTIPFKIYSPYTFAVTGQPVWVQTVLPDSNNIVLINVDWGDGTTSSYDNALNTEFYFSHIYTSASNVPYTATISGNTYTNSYVLTASQRFYIQDVYSSLDLEDYDETLGIYLRLPFTREQVNVGSNEWAVANNINAALGKLQTNFDYLNRITDAIKKSPNLSLVEWVRDLVTYPTWNNNLSGSNTYFNLTGNYVGVIPAGSIVDFKSYKNGLAAPDYYNYIAYDNGLLQIRYNNYNNTLVNQLTSVTPGSVPLNVYGLDAVNRDLYVLASTKESNGNSPVSVYRFYIDENIIPVNQVGGSPGLIQDNNNFSVQPLPDTIRVYNDKVYVGDIGNHCIKVYNPALTYITTIYSNALSAYNVLTFDVNPSTENIYILGKLAAPNVPVITSVATSATINAETEYRVTWNHDGERLNQTASITANFNVYGMIEGGGGYSFINSVSSDLTPYTYPKLTTYVFTTSAVYTSFTVEAIGINGVITSGQSSSKVIPNDIRFPSPYNLFVYNTNSTLLSSFSIPQVPSTATVKKIIMDPVGTFMYVITTENIFKYTTRGIFVNKLLSPSKSYTSLGIAENIITGFIDANYYFYVVTNKRIFKFTDVPITEEVVDNALVNAFYTAASATNINENEYIVDWVYNKAVQPMLYNHEVLAKSINNKYVITFNGDGNLSSFTTRALSATEFINSLSADLSNYVYSNEIVSSAVVNRALNKIYDAQEAILNVLKPEVVQTPTSYLDNVLGRITAATGNIIYQPVTPTPEPPIPPVPEPLPVLFSFASASYTGNVYSDLYNGTSRYGNDFVINLDILNALSSTDLIIDLTNSAGGTTFDDTLYLTVKCADEIIHTAYADSIATYIVPLTGVLTEDSASIAADGILGTYTAKFTITLSVGSILSVNNVKPTLTVASTDGYFYNTLFKGSVMGGDYPSISVSLSGLSGGDIPYAGISNNTLGGYLKNNPYASHTWSIDEVENAVNPSVSLTPSTSTITLSAERTLSGESELLIGLSRVTIPAPEIPTYALVTNTTQTNGDAIGNGYIIGNGSYPAGTVASIFAVATYGSFSRAGSLNQNVFVLSGIGTWNDWVMAPVGSLGYNIENAGGRYDAKIFIDGNKSVDVAFKHF